MVKHHHHHHHHHHQKHSVKGMKTLFLRDFMNRNPKKAQKLPFWKREKSPANPGTHDTPLFLKESNQKPKMTWPTYTHFFFELTNLDESTLSPASSILSSVSNMMQHESLPWPWSPASTSPRVFGTWRCITSSWSISRALSFNCNNLRSS